MCIFGGLLSGFVLFVGFGVVDVVFGIDIGGLICGLVVCCGVVGLKLMFGCVLWCGVVFVDMMFDCVGLFVCEMCMFVVVMVVIVLGFDCV